MPTAIPAVLSRKWQRFNEKCAGSAGNFRVAGKIRGRPQNHVKGEGEWWKGGRGGAV